MKKASHASYLSVPRPLHIAYHLLSVRTPCASPLPTRSHKPLRTGSATSHVTMLDQLIDMILRR